VDVCVGSEWGRGVSAGTEASKEFAYDGTLARSRASNGVSGKKPCG
jgi:hypothetical protein